MTSITDKAHAKINLTLHISAKRHDGYHSIETVMTPIGLADTVTVAQSDRITVKCDNPVIPCDERNIAFKAAKLFFDETSINGGADIKIAKKIPVCGGLGGGSSDGASVLKLLNKLYNAKLSLDDLKILSAKLGSDVPFFIESKTSLCTGRGEIITPICDNSTFSYGACVWGLGASTALMYAEADKEKRTYRSSDTVIKALENNDIELLCEGIFNDFEPICNKLRPDTLKLKNAFLQNGALASCLSGSGASVFGVFKSQSDALRTVNKLKKHTQT